jgi:ABC-type amino acid transport substrate-binding protein
MVHPRKARRRRQARAGFVSLLVAVALQGVPALAGDLAAVQARGKLVMLCYPVQGSPFVAANLDAMRRQSLTLTQMHRPEQFSGAEIDILAGFAKSLGVELEIRPIVAGYSALLPALLAGQGDLVGSELTVTPGRQKQASFSLPYISGWLAVVTRQDSKLATAADLAGRTGAVVQGSSHLEFLLAAAPKVKVVATSFDLEGLEAVAGGHADFTLRDSGVTPGALLDALHPDLKVAFRLRTIDDAFAARPGSDLLPPLDAYLTALRKSGDLDRILDRNAVGPDKRISGSR